MWKLFKYFATGVFALAIIWFLSGFVRFPDAPIKICGEEKYCGKQGQERSKQDYEAFLFWHYSLFVTHPLGMLMAILLAVFKNKTD